MLLRTLAFFGGIGLSMMLGCGGTTPHSLFSGDSVLQYTSLAGLDAEYGGKAYVVGKAVVINTGETISLSRSSMREEKHYIPANTLSAAHGKIDPIIRASTPSEVATIVLLEWSKVSLGEAAAGTKYRLRCQVTIVDKELRRVVARKTFLGGEPAFATLYGASPEQEILRWVSALPRQRIDSTHAESGQKGLQSQAAVHGTRPPGDSSAQGGSDERVVVRDATREYMDATNGLSFQYPTAWKEMGPAEARQLMGASTSKYLTVVIYDPDDQAQNVNLQVLPAAAKDLTDASYSDFAKEMDRQMPSTFSNFQKISSHVSRLLDMVSLEYIFEATRPDGVRLRQKQLRTGKPGREVVASFTAKADLYQRADETCFKIIVDTLKLK